MFKLASCRVVCQELLAGTEILEGGDRMQVGVMEVVSNATLSPPELLKIEERRSGIETKSFCLPA